MPYHRMTSLSNCTLKAHTAAPLATGYHTLAEVQTALEMLGPVPHYHKLLWHATRYDSMTSKADTVESLGRTKKSGGLIH